MATIIRAPINHVTFRGYALGAARAVPNSTQRRPSYRYSRRMPEPFVDDGFPERWAAWQARGAAHSRATRRKLFVVAALLVLSMAILGSAWTF